VVEGSDYVYMHACLWWVLDVVGGVSICTCMHAFVWCVLDVLVCVYTLIPHHTPTHTCIHTYIHIHIHRYIHT
jgi:hypothetical protein